MEIIKNLNIFKKPETPITLVIGNFDSVHRGHLHLINEAKKYASAAGEHLGVLTFTPHPITFFSKNKKPINIFKDSDKCDRIKKSSVDFLFNIEFNTEIANLTPEEFILFLKKYINIGSIFVGEDFSFGKNRAGNISTLEKLSKSYNFKFHSVKLLEIEQDAVSSSSVRKFLSDGKIKNASNLLGYSYYIKGKVIKGKQNGHKIGFKTANVALNNLFLPKFGVYTGRVTIEGFNKIFDCVVNVGKRPTIDEQVLLEAHILNFNKDIYELNIKVQILDFLREQKKFENIFELKKQLTIDVEKTKKLLQ